MPTELLGQVVARVRTEDPPMAVWRRWLPAAAVVVLAVGVVASGIALWGDVRGRALFREGPTADLKTLETGEFAFDYPAAWHGYDASAAGSGFSSIAVLGTQPVERRCGNERHVDLNCVYEQRIEPGQIRLFVGTGAYRGQTIQDRAPIENGSTSRVWVGGMPAIVDAFDPRPDSYYGEDQLIRWEIARPATNGTNVVRLEAMLEEPGIADARRQLDALVASFRFTNGPDPSASETPEPTPTEAAPRLGELPVKTVKDLIAAAEAPTAGEVVVRGWLARSSAIVDCQIELDPHPLIPYCADFGLYLMDENAPVDRGSVGPSVPHVFPMLRVDAHTAATIAPGDALEVLALGHQLDHRWTTCPEAQQADCKARFVIDRVVAADQPLTDDLPDPWSSPDGLPVTAPPEAVEVLSSVVGGVTVVSIGVADPDALRSIEWHTRAKPDLHSSWVIRALIGGDAEPIARTFLVGDEGHPTVFEVTETGIVDLIGQPVSTPPTEVFGLPVISVEEAIAIRDAGRDDREIAVRGWFPPSVPVPCPRQPTTSPLESSCQNRFEVLMADEEQLIDVRLDGYSTHGPAGLAISIDVDGVDQSWKPRLPTLAPVDLIAVGHFDDRRSGWCDPSRINACRDRFVVDRVEWVDGATQPLSLVIATGADGPLFAPVEANVIAALPDRPLLSAAVWRGADLGQVEPSLREERLGITDQAAVWIVRVLDDGRAATYLVIDGTDRTYVMETDGQTVLVGGAPAENRERTWPPTGVQDVPMPEGPSGLVSKAGVVDRSGLVVEARPAGDADPRGPTTSLLAGQMAIVQAAPDTIIAYWDGSLCDDRFVLTVYGDRAGEPPDRLELRGERAKSCRLALATRGIVLRFSQPVDAAAIHGWDRVGTPFETFPPVDSAVVFLAKDGGFVSPRARAALIDLSGRVSSVRAPEPDEPRVIDVDADGPVVFLRDRSIPGRYHLYWTGGVCDGDSIVTIDAELSKVSVHAIRQEPCDTMGVERRLVIDIDGALDPNAVETTYTETVTGAS
jgi:hypothetical protein